MTTTEASSAEPSPAPARPATSSLALLGLVLAVLAPVVGLVVSIVALRRTGPDGPGGRGLALAGTIVGSLLTIAGALGIVAVNAALSSVSREFDATAPTASTPVVSTMNPTAVAGLGAAPVETAGGVPRTGFGVGDLAPDGGLTFTVTGVERLGPTVGEGPLEETAQGEFVVVRVDVTNTGTEPRRFEASHQVARDASGREFSTSQAALFSLEDSGKALAEEINPGNGVAGAPLLFDVPPGTTLTSVELHDAFYSDGVVVALE